MDVSASKVPEITLLFWVTKICATTLGETAGDLLSMTLNVGYVVSSLVLLSAFAATLAVQLSSRTYRPAVYWAVILSTSTAGTTLSDTMDRTLGLGYTFGSAVLLTLLVIVLLLWRVTVGSLSVATVRSRRVESFYWAAILVSNTLGTALGDFLADSSGLGFAGGALLIAASIGCVLLAYGFTSVSRTTLFWIAFVLTRPLGATVGDLLTKTADRGGLDLGTVGSSVVLGAVLIGCVALASRRRRLDEHRS